MAAGRASRLSRSIDRRFLALGALGGIGMGLAIGHASSGDWYWLNASALGADPGSDIYFNTTMFALGLAFLWAVIPLRALLAEVPSAGLADPRWMTAYRRGLVAVGIALSLTGVFQVGGARISHAIHNAAGFTAPLVVMAMMVSIHWGLPSVGRRFEAGALLAVAGIVAMFVLSVTDRMSYALMEMLSFVVCGFWLYTLAARLAADVETPIHEAPAASG